MNNNSTNKKSTIQQIFNPIFISCLLILGIATSCNDKESIVVNPDAQVVMKDHNDSLSWALGFTMAQNMAIANIDINRELLFQAICVTLDSKPQPMTQQETYTLLQELEYRAYMNQSKNQEKKLEETRAREEVYFSNLTKNNPNVKKSDKGFYYEVLKEGSGRKGEIGLIAVFDYKGYFTNGQIIDQTYGNCDPIRHVISESIFPGLLEGLCMMRAGSKYRFYFPSETAFGAQGTDNIPPFTTIIYEVEVHEILD